MFFIFAERRKLHMSEFTDNLMKQLHFVSKASNQYMHQNNQRLTGQQRVLSILNLEDNLSQSYLQEVLDLRPSSLAELLKKLEDKGEITRSEDPTDKRIKRIKLTDQGRKTAEANSASKVQDATERFFSGLSDDEQQQLKDNLDKVADGWDDEFKKQADSFVDPMDRFASMQKVREEMIKKYGDDFENMTEDDARAFRKEMRSKMQDMGMMMRGKGHGMGHGPMGHGSMRGGHGMHGCDGPRMGRRADFRFDGRW